jgi:hypothetical protein
LTIGAIAIALYALPAAGAGLTLTPRVKALLKNDNSQLELGAQLWGFLYVFGRVPSADSDVAVLASRIDGFTSSWRLGAGAKKDLDWTTGAEPTVEFLRFGAGIEWGQQRFSFFPGGGVQEIQETHDSIDAECSILYYWKRKGFAKRVPQLLVRYARDWEEGAETGIVVAGSGMQPSTVVDKVILPPAAIPTLTWRFTYITDLTIVPGFDGFGLGPSMSYMSSGDSRGESPFGEAEVLRTELWFYYFPVDEESVNVRVGLAPFWSRSFAGTPEIDESDVGAMLQMRIGKTGFTY